MQYDCCQLVQVAIVKRGLGQIALRRTRRDAENKELTLLQPRIAYDSAPARSCILIMARQTGRVQARSGWHADLHCSDMSALDLGKARN